MNSLRYRRRWSPWWAGVILGIHYAIVAYFIGKAIQSPTLQTPGSGPRIFIALLAPVAYWMLASIFNSYTSTVRISGVRLASFPFPTGGGEFIRRRHINVCYARKIIVTTKYGAEAYHYFAIGVQTNNGYQADIHSRYNTANDALAAAREVSMILNSDPNSNPIPVELVKTTHSNPAIWRQLLLWGTITFIALILGSVWDRP